MKFIHLNRRKTAIIFKCIQNMEVSFLEEGTRRLKTSTSHDSLHRDESTMIFRLNKIWDQFSIPNHSSRDAFFPLEIAVLPCRFQVSFITFKVNNVPIKLEKNSIVQLKHFRHFVATRNNSFAPFEHFARAIFHFDTFVWHPLKTELQNWRQKE